MTIPAYIRHFQLLGMIVLAKDDPVPELVEQGCDLSLPVTCADVADLGRADQVGIHYYPLAEVLSTLTDLREELDTLTNAQP